MNLYAGVDQLRTLVHDRRTHMARAFALQGVGFKANTIVLDAHDEISRCIRLVVNIDPHVLRLRVFAYIGKRLLQNKNHLQLLLWGKPTFSTLNIEPRGNARLLLKALQYAVRGLDEILLVKPCAEIEQ